MSEERRPFITYDLIEEEIETAELAEILKDLLDDPRCEGFDGLEMD